MCLNQQLMHKTILGEDDDDDANYSLKTTVAAFTMWFVKVRRSTKQRNERSEPGRAELFLPFRQSHKILRRVSREVKKQICASLANVAGAGSRGPVAPCGALTDPLEVG